MRRGLVGVPPLLGVVQPGHSWLHRAAPADKLAALVLVGAGVGTVRLFVPETVAAAVLVVLAVLIAGLARFGGLRTGLLVAPLRRVWWLFVALTGVQLWTAGPARAATTVLGLVVCLWAATVVSTTTPVPAMLDTVVRAAGPLRRVGVDPDRVALGLTLTITSIPVVGRLLAESREAAAARGLGGDPRALLVPTLVRTVAHAEALGEALAARGLD